MISNEVSAMLEQLRASLVDLKSQETFDALLADSLLTEWRGVSDTFVYQEEESVGGYDFDL